MSAQVTRRGTPVQVTGHLPEIGATLPDFALTAADLSDARLADFAGQRKLFNIFPSLDTPTCALSVQRFNAEIAALDNAVLFQVSADLPFAHKRFCSAFDLANGVTLSMMRDKRFAEDYGVLMADGPMAGLCARAVVVADANNRVVYSELVPEIGQEPDYEAALAAARAA